MEGDLGDLKIDIFFGGVTGMCGGFIFDWSPLFFVHSDGVLGGHLQLSFFGSSHL